MDIPIFKFVIGDDEDEMGMVAISLVENPAFETKFLAFDKDEKPIHFVEDKRYKQVLTGLVMIPNQLIYRYDKDMGEYYGFFTPEEIEKIRNRFHKQKHTSNVNTEHNPLNTFNGYVIESYILNSDARIQEALDLGLVDAVRDSWVVSLKIEDENVFNDVLQGKYNGFSIESFLELEKFTMQKNNFNVKKSKMKSKLEKIKDKILSIFTELVEFETAVVPELGFEIQWGEIGEPVFKILPQEDGEVVQELVGGGEYTLEDGRVLSVDDDSNLVEIKEVAEEEEDVEVELTKSKGKYIKGEEVIEAEIAYSEVDAPVFIDETPIEEVIEIGEEVEVELESGTILVVGEDGLLDEIKEVGEVVVDEAPAGEVPAEEFDAKDYIKLAEHKREVRKLQKEIKKLKEKMAEAIAEPILTNEKNEDVDVTKLSRYERLMHEKGLQPLFTKK